MELARDGALRAMQPDFSESFCDRLFLRIDPAVRDRYFDGLYRAGWPRPASGSN